MSTNSSQDRRRELTRLRVRRFREKKRELSLIHEEEDLRLHNIQSHENVVCESNNSDTTFNNSIPERVSGENHDTILLNNLSDCHDDIEEQPRLEERVSDLVDNPLEVPETTNNESSNSEPEEELNDTNNYLEQLDDLDDIRKWALSNPPIPHTRLEALMNILRRKAYPTLPKNAKTFLRTTSTDYKIESFDGEDEFVYFGIKNNLQLSVNISIHKNNKIELMFNIDGLPLFKSNNKQIWPILCKVFHSPDIYRPFIVAIYCGNTKPTDIEKYLKKFIEEINDLLSGGININDKEFSVSIKAFICDAPARSFLKSTKGHGGFGACERCNVYGERYNNRTIYFTSVETVLRTDESFRLQSDRNHHNGVSPLVNINPRIDLVKTFVLDSMHLISLGVMKKLLEYWIDGKINNQHKLSQNAKSRLSDLLKRVKVPDEFQRSTRSLAEFHKFKANEFNFLLLYSGPVIFKDILAPEVYKHYLLLHVACRILSSKNLIINGCRYARYLLSIFVTVGAILYKPEFLVSIVHNLTHLTDDVENIGCSLPEISAFPFENKLGSMKNLIRTGNRPLAQLCRRLNELSEVESNIINLEPDIVIVNRLLPDASGKTTIKRIKYKKILLTTRPPNNTVLLTDKRLAQIFDIYIPPEGDISSIRISGKILRKRKDAYKYPCPSRDFNIWNVSERNTRNVDCEITKIDKKMVCFDLSDEIKEKLYVFPLLHM